MRSKKHRGDLYLTLAVTGLLVGAFVTEITLLRGSKDSNFGIGFEYIKLAIIFFLAGKLVETYFQLRHEVRDVEGIVGYFDLDRSTQPRKACFVLPVFEAVDSTESYRFGPVDKTVRERRAVQDPTRKELHDSFNGTFVMEDVLASMEIAARLGQAGVEDFVIVDDGHFLWELTQQKSGSGPFEIHRRQPGGTSAEDSPKTSTGNIELIDTIIVIGLWSNLVTGLLSESKDFAQLNMDCRLPGQPRSLRVGVDSVECVVWNEDDAEQIFALRRKYSDVTLVVIGGITASATARVGESLLRGKALAKFLENARGKNGAFASASSMIITNTAAGKIGGTDIKADRVEVSSNDRSFSDRYRADAIEHANKGADSPRSTSYLPLKK